MSDTFVAIRPIDPLDLTAHNFLLLVLQQHYFVGFTIIANGCSYRRTAAQELRSSQGRQSSLFPVLENSARRISGKYLLRPLVIHVEVFYRDAFTLSFVAGLRAGDFIAEFAKHQFRRDDSVGALMGVYRDVLEGKQGNVLQLKIIRQDKQVDLTLRLRR